MFKHAIFAILLGSAFVGGACMAHAKLQSSAPAANSQLSETPASLTLNFSEPAQLAVLTLVIDEKEITIPVDRRAKASASITLPLPKLAPGKYMVHWTAMAADDGHVTKGSFAFSIAG
jgi:methionine-rich copper-binding protein CopC